VPDGSKDKKVEQTSWAPEHSRALREYHARGMSYSEIVKAINAKFATCYTRNAVLGRAKRMGLADTEQERVLKQKLANMLENRASRAKSPETNRSDTRSSALRLPEFGPRRLAGAKIDPVELRCVDVSPRHLLLVELERDDCRYPYGGDQDGSAITFCAHPRRKGSSYCTPHFHLTRDPVIPEEQTVGTAPLRLVDADEIFDRVMETDTHGTNQTQEAAQSGEGARPAIA
jgi:GcrA cell cycle regulator